MLHVERLTARYPGSDVDVISEVGLEIPAGGALGLVGESGSGKSTVARAILGLLPLSGASRVVVDGVDTTMRGPAETAHLRRRAQMVFQDPNASLHPRLRVGAAVAEAAGVVPGRTRSEAAQEVPRLFDLVGLPARLADRYPFELSGGQRQRVAIARALAADPRLLILDEVTASLDVSIQATVLNLLRDLQEDLGLTYLAISHDLAVMRHLCDEIAVMEGGSVKERAGAERLFASPRHPYSAALLDAVPRIGRSEPRTFVLVGEPTDAAHRPPGCSFHGRCPVGPEVVAERARCREEVPELLGSPHAVACHYPLAVGEGVDDTLPREHA